jgi:hypothetical protein
VSKSKCKLYIKLIVVTLLNYNIAISQLVSQHFSSVVPAGWLSTSNTWILNYDGSSTENYNNTYDATKYSARFPSASTGNNIYLYIPVTFTSGETYSVSFYTKRCCSISLLVNEDATQNTVLSNNTLTNTNCSSNFSLWYYWSFTYKATYSGSGYIQLKVNTVYGGPTSVYLDDIDVAKVVVLPIELLYLKAKAGETNNVIQWSTASENDNDYFTVEKTNDGINYTEITRLNGSGNSYTQLYYEVYDYDIDDKICYYRLQQVDFNGDYIYHDLISVRNNLKHKILVKVINTHGMPVDISTKGLVLLLYDDNTIVKILN